MCEHDPEELFQQTEIQLMDGDPQTRVAAVHALADIADTWKGEYKQRVVDALCGYLRAPRLTQTGAFDDSVTQRRIVETLRAHLLTAPTYVPEELSWSDCCLNLENARINVPVDFSDCTISDLNAKQACFTKNVSLENSVCKGTVDFHGARFGRYLKCTCAVFFGDFVFSEVTMVDIAEFSNTHFHGATKFNWTTFIEWVIFDKAEFTKRAEFVHVDFHQGAGFKPTTFHGGVNFGFSFFKYTAFFHGCDFFGDATFANVIFRKEAIFRASRFRKEARFTGSIFGDWAYFPEATFNGDTDFSGVKFHDEVHFDGADFSLGSPFNEP